MIIIIKRKFLDCLFVFSALMDLIKTLVPGLNFCVKEEMCLVLTAASFYKKVNKGRFFKSDP